MGAKFVPNGARNKNPNAKWPCEERHRSFVRCEDISIRHERFSTYCICVKTSAFIKNIIPLITEWICKYPISDLIA